MEEQLHREIIGTIQVSNTIRYTLRNEYAFDNIHQEVPELTGRGTIHLVIVVELVSYYQY